mmetsp:Transcript_164543/g.400015  ORF Transcript_164543/g.400015 Transcript_164543/m.400015 type:complete len:204 (-) Transcript_164543:252-863(-)
MALRVRCSCHAPWAFAAYTLLNISGAFWMFGTIKPSCNTPAAWTMHSPTPILRWGMARAVGTVMFFTLTPKSVTCLASAVAVFETSLIAGTPLPLALSLSLATSSATSSSLSLISCLSATETVAPSCATATEVLAVLIISFWIFSMVSSVPFTSSGGISSSWRLVASMTSPNVTACSVRKPGRQKACSVSYITAPSEPSALTM